MEIFVTVQRPKLTPEERDRRMAAIKKAATDLIVATMKNPARQLCDRAPVKTE